MRNLLLLKTGILGINARNLLYIRPFNKKNAIRLADNKLKTKHYLSVRGIPVAKLYGSIQDKQQIEKFHWNTLPKSFVIKPNRGFGGEGILVIDNFDHNDEDRLESISNHILNILEGNFSLSSAPDLAIIEQKIIPHPYFLEYGITSLPDVRIIVHNLIPVMAMLRIPTPESGDTANLHQGGAIAGIDLANGTITHIFHKGKLVDNLPFSKKPLRKFQIPKWDEILKIAATTQVISNLGYLAIDIVIDKNENPLVLELNARGGLGIQLANQAPLKERLDRIMGLKVQTPEKGVRLAKDLFGSTIEKEITQLSGKIVVGVIEPVEILLGKKGTHKVIASIDTSYKESVIDRNLAINLKLISNDGATPEFVQVDFILGGRRIKTKLYVDILDDIEEHMIVGKSDLSGYLLDPEKKHTARDSKKVSLITPTIRSDYPEIDRKLAFIDEKLSILKYLRPINAKEEEERFFQSPDTYNPQFEYSELDYDSENFMSILQELKTDDTPLGQLFDKKRNELIMTILMLENRDTDDFTKYSIDLYGDVTKELLDIARTRLSEMPSSFEEEKIYTALEARRFFEETIKYYGLDWKISISEKISSQASVGKSGKLFIRKDAVFPKSKIYGTIAHEIETHILSAENGKLQPYLLFNRGFANYLKTQEGLAVYNQEEFIETGRKNIKYYMTAANILAVYYAHKFSFVESYQMLKKHNISDTDAFRLILKAKRGIRDTSKPGCFTKGSIYLKGALMIQDFASNGGDLKKLYVGKIALEDLDIIYAIPTLRPPTYLPKFLI